ncbi:hypothetical protein VUR80DRAFT_3588 [Thermomyces stellatus]
MRPPNHKIVPWSAVSRPSRALCPPRPTTTSHRPLLTVSAVPRPRSRRAFHPTPTYLPRRRDFFTSNMYLQKNAQDASDPPAPPSPQVKRKPRAGVKKSLRRVAIIAQQPSHRGLHPADAAAVSANMISAVCAAEGFNMATVQELLSARGYDIDPDGTGFEAAEVLHARRSGQDSGDVLVFPSGTIVTWSLPIEGLMEQLLPAAEDPHEPSRREFEDLEYTTEADRDSCAMKGDLVVLGTRRESTTGEKLDTTLAKVAFSSGLARSTKLAVLESDLATYFEHTRSIPSILSKGSRLTLSRTFIHQKTGELLSLSARLNNYSELTDSLPDIFWDSRADLGLEGYYDQVGRALDVNVRIRTLNQRLDYAQDIASVLREMSGERHSTRLEVIIILLIAVEVVFELRREWKEYQARGKGVEGEA